MKGFKNKYEYSLNAIYYCMNKRELGSDIRTLLFFHKILFPLLTERNKEKVKENVRKSQNVMVSMTEGRVDNIFEFLYMCYILPLSYIIEASVIISGVNNIIALFLFFCTPIIIAYRLAYQVIHYKKRYLIYRKHFDKESPDWHKKWERRTILFGIGGAFSFAVVGPAIAWLILFL